jgi:hypothetical protein
MKAVIEQSRKCHWLDSSAEYDDLLRAGGEEEEQLYRCRTDGSCQGHRQLHTQEGVRTDPMGCGNQEVQA